LARNNGERETGETTVDAADGDVEGSRHLVGPEAHPLSPTATAIQSSDGFPNGVVVRPSRSYASDPGISDAEDVR